MPTMFFLAAVILFVAAEFVIGWWTLPVIGLVLGLVGARRKGVSVQVGVAALTAWLTLFGWTELQGELGIFMHSLAVSMKLAPVMLLAVIVALPVLMASAAARLGAGLRPESSAVTPS